MRGDYRQNQVSHFITLFADAVLMFSLVLFMFSVMFAKTSLLFCCFCIRLLVSNFVCVVPYGVMQNLDAINRVSNYARLNPDLQRARPLWSGAKIML